MRVRTHYRFAPGIGCTGLNATTPSEEALASVRGHGEEEARTRTQYGVTDHGGVEGGGSRATPLPRRRTVIRVPSSSRVSAARLAQSLSSLCDPYTRAYVSARIYNIFIIYTYIYIYTYMHVRTYIFIRTHPKSAGLSSLIFEEPVIISYAGEEGVRDHPPRDFSLSYFSDRRSSLTRREADGGAARVPPLPPPPPSPTQL